VEQTSSGFIDTLSNLNVVWILAIVAVLTLVRYNMLKTDGDSLQTIAEYVESGIVAIVLVWMIIRPFAVQAYFIPSPSMEPTLFGENGSGDRILVNKFTYRFQATGPSATMSLCLSLLPTRKNLASPTMATFPSMRTVCP